jgi:hypothetical protein
VAFDHARQSRFALDSNHRDLTCATCHRPEQGVVRYRPLARSCAACHGPARREETGR